MRRDYVACFSPGLTLLGAEMGANIEGGIGWAQGTSSLWTTVADLRKGVYQNCALGDARSRLVYVNRQGIVEGGGWIWDLRRAMTSFDSPT